MVNSRLIGLLHIVWSFAFPIYFLLRKASKWDAVYIFYIFGIYLSWTIFNGECFISYVDKWMKNKDYKAGDDPAELEDFHEVFGKETYERVVFPLLVMLWAVTNWVIFSRNSQYIPIPWTIGMLILLILYLRILRSKNKSLTSVVNEVFKIYLVAMLTVYIISLAKRK